MVANLTGWNGGILYKPWYRWLSSNEILLEGGDSITEGFSRPPGRGEEGMLYSLSVRADLDKNELLKQQRPIALTELSRRTQAYGGVHAGTIVSPDGRWLLSAARRTRRNARNDREERFWCAVSTDGKLEVSWPLKRPPIERRPSEIDALSTAYWLPDSSGILEREIHVVFGPQWSYLVVGRIWRLESSVNSYPLPLVHLPHHSWYFFVQDIPDIPGASTAPSVRIVALEPVCQNKSGNSYQDILPDQIIVHTWDWSLHRRPFGYIPVVHTNTITLPVGYELLHLSPHAEGNQICMALMDRTHYQFVSSPGRWPTSYGDGELGLWVCGIDQGGTDIREIGHLLVPLGKEAEYYQLFGPGGWLPDGQRISFIFNRMLYTVTVS